MFKHSIPAPKYPYVRYATSQLMAWYEDCALFEATADKEYEETGKYSASAINLLDIARWTRWGIDDVLQERGVSHEELGAILRLTKEDVYS